MEVTAGQTNRERQFEGFSCRFFFEIDAAAAEAGTQ